MRWLKRIVLGFLASLGLAVLVLAGFAYWLGAGLLSLSAPSVPDVAVVTLDLAKPLLQPAGEEPLTELFERDRLSLRQVEEALERAGRDGRVKGLVLRLGGEHSGVATTQELRDAVTAFRKRGKFVLAFAESYDDGGGAGDYYLASACEEIWLQPSGELGLVGVVAETPFLRGTLDKLGVVPRFDKREEYKTAIDELTESAYTPAFKESLESILGSLYGQLVRAIADGRGLGADAVKALIDRGPFLAQEAFDAKLVDRLGYRDEALAAAKRRAGSGAETVSLSDYFRAGDDGSGQGRTIAVIAASGPIVSGESGFDGPLGISRIGADSLVDALDEAAKSSEVAAILLRIDSPGGSYVASDTIWRAVARAKAAGKPVIVSMGDVAASGGYFIAAPATKIVAEPGTLTASIGVFGGKLVVKELLEKLGVSVGTVQFGANAGISSATRDFTPEGWNRLEASLDAVYRDFTAKVASGRGLDPSRIPTIAKGRVFTGEDALALGLVDALGGFPKAVELAREAAGIAAGEPVRLTSYPRHGREFRRLLRQLLSESGGAEVRLAAGLAKALGGSLAALRPLLAELPALAGPGEAWLLMPPLAVR